ncbi:hypothetical protein M408DRAFT_77218, partial [Serendipita vermifera MAFF 305830]
LTVRVWDTETGEMVAGPIVGHTNWVNSVDFSPDGRRIVSGSDDMTVRIWDAETGELVLGPFEGHTDRIRSVAFSPDGQYVDTNSDLPLFTNTSHMVDGWMLGPNSELLFWVPPTLRTGLWMPGNTAVIGIMATRLGFHHCAHGESWTRCKDSLST